MNSHPHPLPVVVLPELDQRVLDEWLVVGGVGILTILTIAVAERTSEIGLRDGLTDCGYYQKNDGQPG